MTRQGGGETGGEACRPRPETTEESFVASSGRSFLFRFWTWTQIDDEDGEGNTMPTLLKSSDSDDTENNELAQKGRVNRRPLPECDRLRRNADVLQGYERPTVSCRAEADANKYHPRRNIFTCGNAGIVIVGFMFFFYESGQKWPK